MHLNLIKLFGPFFFTANILLFRLPSMEQLKETFASGLTRPREWRMQQLTALKALLKENHSLLIQALSQDFKCQMEAELEFASCVSSCSLAISNLDSWMRPEPKSCPFPFKFLDSAFVKREPKGLVLIVGAWNFPLMLVVEPFVGAIAAGNTVIIKPSEFAPRTAAMLSQLIPRYLDGKAFAVREGDAKVCQELISSPLLDHIFFTGSPRVGKLVYQAAAQNLTPVTLELGGKNPVIFTAKADTRSAIQRIVWGRCFNAGQACIAPEYVLFTEPMAKERLTKDFVNAVCKMHGESAQFLSNFPTEAHASRIKEIINEIPSAWIAYNGNGNKEENSEEKRRIFPVIVSVPSLEEASKLRIMQEEIFGPILILIQAESLNHAISVVNQGEKPLALYVFSKDKHEVQQVLESTSSGAVCVNDVLMQSCNENLPFGGIGKSGLGGAYHGRYSFEVFSHPKAVLWRGTKDEFANEMLRYPPACASGGNLMTKFLYRG